MSKQFLHGICRICGKDHKDVMRDDSMVRYANWITHFNGHTPVVKKKPRFALVDDKYEKSWVLVPDKFLEIFRRHLKEFDVDIIQKKQLKNNISRVEECNQKFINGIGYEYLVTINFTEDYDLDLLKDNIEKLLKANYRYLKKGKFVVEFHGKEKNHWHIHVAIKSLLNRRKASIAKQLSKLMGVAQNYVDICQSYGDPEQYVLGVKTDSKREQVELDIELRNKLKLKHLYII